MRYSNLKAEMVRKGIKISDLSKLLGKSISSIDKLVACKTRLNLEDAFKIRDTFFPGMTLEYLFEKK